MKLPRDLSGHDLVKALRKYGYYVVRQSGSHIRLTSSIHGLEHHITVPAHKSLKVGTLNAIISSIAVYLEMDRETLSQELFGK